MDSLEKEVNEEDPSLDLELRSELVSVVDDLALLQAARGVRSLALQLLLLMLMSLLVLLLVVAKSSFFSVRWDFLRFATVSLGSNSSASSPAMVVLYVKRAYVCNVSRMPFGTRVVSFPESESMTSIQIYWQEVTCCCYNNSGNE